MNADQKLMRASQHFQGPPRLMTVIGMFVWLTVHAVPFRSEAADLYVASTGTASEPFNTWTTAFDNLQDAFDYASDGDTIHLAGHTFAGGPAAGESYVFCLTNKVNLTVIGGYKADAGSPGERDPEQWPTLLKRDVGEAGVLHLVGVSNVVVRGVTIRDGLVPEAFAKGGGVYLSDSLDVMFDDCRIIENIIPVGTAYAGRPASYGAGLYLHGSTITLTHSIVSDNKNLGSDSTFNSGTRYAGAAYVDGASTMEVVDSRIERNEAGNRGNPNRGGGFYIANGGRLDVRGSVIEQNRIIGGHYGTARGAGFYVENGAEVEVRQSRIADNETGEYVLGGVFHTPTQGGGFYNESGGSLLLMESVVVSNRAALSRGGFGGGIYNLGTAHLRNVLIAGNVTSTRGPIEASDGIWTGGSAARMLLDNCTVADNNRDAKTSVGIRYDGGVFNMTNSIVWGQAHDLLGFTPDETGLLPNIWYSNIGGGMNVGRQGCHSTDPRFADHTWYHLQSTEGHYTGGYFGGGEWTAAASNSPLIARGNPSAAFNREPAPNGNRINIGAYGNTEVAASLASGIATTAIGNPGVHTRSASAAILRGVVTDDGGQSPEATFEYWIADESATNQVALGIQTSAFECAVYALTPDKTYQYRIRAENAAGVTLATVQSFATLPAATTNWYVSTDGDASDGTGWSTAYTNLGWALAAMQPGDTLHLAGQTFSGAGSAIFGDHFVFRLAGASNLTLIGGYQASAALPAGEHPGPRDSVQWPTILERTDGYGSVLHLIGVSNVLIRGMTIREGWVSPWFRKGGGVYLSNSTDVVLDTCHITGNKVFGVLATGGGLHLDNSAVTLVNCLVAGNNSRQPGIPDATEFNYWARAFGGGISIDAASQLSLAGTTVASNRVQGSSSPACGGGGLYIAGKLEMEATKVQDNLAGQDHYGYVHGGGLFIANGGEAYVRNSTISDNVNAEHPDRLSVKRYGTHGAGFYVAAGGLLDLGESEITGNLANGGTTAAVGDLGAAIYNLGKASIRNTLVVSNRSVVTTQSSHGGAIWSGGAASVTAIESSTVADNATVAGIHHDAGAIALTNTIVWGHAEDLRNWPSENGVLRNVSHALFATPEGMHGVDGCLTSNPLFVGNGNYRLQDGSSAQGGAISPAIDAGIRFPWMESMNDLDGNRRVIMGKVDIGAYEAAEPGGTLFLIR